MTNISKENGYRIERWRTNRKQKNDISQGSPRAGEEKVPVATFSGAKIGP